MNDDSNEPFPSDLGIVESWRPSGELQRKLIEGVVAVLVASSLAIAGLLLSIANDPQKGFTVAMALGFAALIPQVWVLRAFLGLAKEAESDGLKRTSIGIYGAEWLFQCLALADEAIMPEAAIAVLLLAIIVAFLVLLIYCFLPVFKVSGLFTVMFILLSFRAYRHLPQVLPVLRQADPIVRLLILSAGLFAIALVILVVWFGVLLIRLRHRLGGMAALAGWGYLLGLLGALVVGGWFINEVIVAAQQPGALGAEFEDLVQPQLVTMTVAGVFGEVYCAALNLLLFLGARGRGATSMEELGE